MLISTVRMTIAQPQFEAMCRVDELQRQKEILADGTEEAEVQQRLQRLLGIRSRGCREHVDRLRPDEDARLRMAAGVAERRAEDRHHRSALGRRHRCRSPVSLDRLRHIELPSSVATVAVAGESGRKTAAKNGRSRRPSRRGR
jgi:hypothetical protein